MIDFLGKQPHVIARSSEKFLLHARDAFLARQTGGVVTVSREEILDVFGQPADGFEVKTTTLIAATAHPLRRWDWHEGSLTLRVVSTGSYYETLLAVAAATVDVSAVSGTTPRIKPTTIGPSDGLEAWWSTIPERDRMQTAVLYGDGSGFLDASRGANS